MMMPPYTQERMTPKVRPDVVMLSPARSIVPSAIACKSWFPRIHANSAKNGKTMPPIPSDRINWSAMRFHSKRVGPCHSGALISDEECQSAPVHQSIFATPLAHLVLKLHK